MSLLGVQTLTARLLVDEEFRDAFFQEPFVPEGVEVTSEELQQLMDVNREHIRINGIMLAEKRVRSFLKILPLAVHYLGQDRFSDLGRDYCFTHVKSPSHDNFVYADSKAFVEWLTDSLRSGELQAPYLADLLAIDFEQSRLRFECAEEASRFRPPYSSLELTEEYVLASRPVTGAHHTVLAFDYDVFDLIRQINSASPIESVANSPSWVLLTKIPDQVEVKTFRLNHTSVRLVERCDGSRTVREIFDELSIPPEHRSAWLQLLYQFHDVGLIKLIHFEEEPTCAE